MVALRLFARFGYVPTMLVGLNLLAAKGGALPATWDAIPAGQASVGFGSEWLRSRRSTVLLVPSVIVPEECCVLINPQHPLAGRISARVSRGLEYGRLFRRGWT